MTRKWLIRMSKFEDQVQAWLEDKGWTVLRSGWPDFFCLKYHAPKGNLPANGAGYRGFGLELKQGADFMRENQLAMHDALAKIGFPSYVMRPENMTDAFESELASCRAEAAPNYLRGIVGVEFTKKTDEIIKRINENVAEIDRMTTYLKRDLKSYVRSIGHDCVIGKHDRATPTIDSYVEEMP